MEARTAGALLSIVIAATVAAVTGVDVGRLTAGSSSIAYTTFQADSRKETASTAALSPDVMAYIMAGPVEQARELGLRDEQVEPVTVLDNQRPGDQNEQIVVVRLFGLDDDGPVAILLGVYVTGADHTPVQFRAYDYEQ